MNWSYGHGARLPLRFAAVSTHPLPQEADALPNQPRPTGFALNLVKAGARSRRIVCHDACRRAGQTSVFSPVSTAKFAGDDVCIERLHGQQNGLDRSTSCRKTETACQAGASPTRCPRAVGIAARVNFRQATPMRGHPVPRRRERRFRVRADADPTGQASESCGAIPRARRYLGGAVQSPTRLPDTAMFIVSLVFVIVMRIWPS